jgi:protein-S-isoprenylcysteine O-methyltransferase Ste14
MEILDVLTTALFIAWIASEILINLFSFRNLLRPLSDRADRLSYLFVSLTTLLPISFWIMIRIYKVSSSGFGSLASLFPMLGYLGCFVMASGITIRLLAVGTLKRQFTVRVSIIEKHEIIDTGIYGVIRHPAYLGHLMSLLGMGLVLGNWVGLMALVVLPLAGILYRINVEERALLHHFGPAYQAYASRTDRLLPGIW